MQEKTQKLLDLYYKHTFDTRTAEQAKFLSKLHKLCKTTREVRSHESQLREDL